MTEPLTREERDTLARVAELGGTRSVSPAQAVALYDRAQELEARLREVEAMLAEAATMIGVAEKRAEKAEAERDRLQEWTDRVAQTSTDAATAAEKAEAVLRVTDDLLRRLSEWDVLNLAPGSGDDGPYWQGEIRKARALLRKETL